MRCIASHSSRCTMAIDFAFSFDIVCSQPSSNHASMYAVKEIFLTLQGEGAQAGRPAVFCRFAGCNLWSGREQDRAAAVCSFCDTDFVGMDGPGGGRFATPDDLARAVEEVWRGGADDRLGGVSGGAPLSQLG